MLLPEARPSHPSGQDTHLLKLWNPTRPDPTPTIPCRIRLCDTHRDRPQRALRAIPRPNWIRIRQLPKIARHVAIGVIPLTKGKTGRCCKAAGAASAFAAFVEGIVVVVLGVVVVEKGKPVGDAAVICRGVALGGEGDGGGGGGGEGCGCGECGEACLEVDFR